MFDVHIGMVLGGMLVVSIELLAASIVLMRARYVGGLTFIRIGRLGGSFYVAKR